MHPLLIPIRRFLWIDGRASRREWWTTMILVLMLGVQLEVTSVFARPLFGAGVGVDGIVRLALSGLLFWIDLASTIRRLHDRGKSGWKAVPYAVPGIGWIWMVIECGVLPSQPGRNQYGPQPDTPAAKAALPGWQQILAALNAKPDGAAKAPDVTMKGPWADRPAPAHREKPAQAAAARPTRGSGRIPAAQPAMARERTRMARERTARRSVVQSSAVTRTDQSRGKTILILAAAAIMGLVVATYVMNTDFIAPANVEADTSPLAH